MLRSTAFFGPFRSGLLGILIMICANPCLAQSGSTAPKREARTQIMTFENEGVTLSGGLYLPATAPVAGIVLVHGAGPSWRMEDTARLFAERGFAVVTYDKRGVGKSGGVYERDRNVSAENLALLAGDARAAMQWLRARPELAGLKSGYWGISQAGWIIPLAASQAPGADFMVLWSGPVCTVAEEIEAGIGKGGNLSTDDRARAFVAQLRVKGNTDPRDALRKLKIPGLWIYGGRDTTLPVALSVERLQGLIDEGQTNFVYWLNSAAGHDMNQQPENRPLIGAMMEWMLEQGSSD